MSGFGDYDTWKLRGPDDDGKICVECGGWLVFGVDPPGWSCESCAAEREIYELIASRQWEGETMETSQQLAADRRAAEADARAKREADQAVAAAEKRRIEQEQAQRQESERREANKRHAAAVNRRARDALVAGGMIEESATLAVTLIASRKIPGIAISY